MVHQEKHLVDVVLVKNFETELTSGNNALCLVISWPIFGRIGLTFFPYSCGYAGHLYAPNETAKRKFRTASRISQAEMTLFGFFGIEATGIVRIKTSVFFPIA